MAKKPPTKQKPKKKRKPAKKPAPERPRKSRIRTPPPLPADALLNLTQGEVPEEFLAPAPGSRAGSPNVKRMTASTIPTRCPRCQSTLRTPYVARARVVKRRGQAPDGQPYSRVVFRNTRCANPACTMPGGQCRVDRSYELHPDDAQ